MKRFGKGGKRGFSLAEVIVALAVIVVVSAAALSLVSSHARLERKSVETIEAAEIAESVIEVFRWWKNNGGEFDEVLSEIGLAKDGDLYTYAVISEGDTIRKYRINVIPDGDGITVNVLNAEELLISQSYERQ